MTSEGKRSLLSSAVLKMQSLRTLVMIWRQTNERPSDIPAVHVLNCYLPSKEIVERNCQGPEL